MNKIYYKQLKNGLKVVFEKRDLPIISTCIMVGIGGFYESRENKGVSHFLEHMIFKGTKSKTRKEIARLIEDRGGILNAFTSEECTCFWNKMPSKYLKESIELNADLVFNPKLDEKGFVEEKNVILQELARSYDTIPSSMYNGIKSLMFEGGCSLPVIGTMESISKMTIKTLKDFHKSTYGTNNMVLGVVGNANWEDILKEAESIPNIQVNVKKPKVKKTNKIQINSRDGLAQASISLGIHAPEFEDTNDLFAYNIFQTILGKGMSSRLFENIREKYGLCYSINSNLFSNNFFSIELINAGVKKENVEKAKELILKEIDSMKDITKTELDTTKSKLKDVYKLHNESTNNALSELCMNAMLDKFEYYKNYDEYIDSIKLQDVTKFSKLKKHSFFAIVSK